MAVRRESVLLELDDQLSSGMARAAAAAALLNRRLTTMNTRLNTVANNPNRNMGIFGPMVNGLNQVQPATSRADQSINRLSGRLALFARLGASLGPALVPIGAVAVPAVTGLAAALGAAALAGGTAVLAFQGVGDALTAVNDAAIEPTSANLIEAEAAMSALSPAAQDLVTRFQELRPAMTDLRDIAAEGMFPGLLEAVDELETRLPEVQRIIERVSVATGGLLADAGSSLASSDFDDFFDFLATEVPQTLVTLGQAVGNVTRGLAELWMAFDPLNDDFNGAILRASQSFAEWADNLSRTEGFADFIAYVRQSGPQVAESVGAIANAMIQIVTAAAPIGGPVLASLEAFADVVAAIAESDFGTPIFSALAAMSAFNLAMRGFTALKATTTFTTLAASVTGFHGAMLAAATAATALQVAVAGAAGAGAVLLVDQIDDVTLSTSQMQSALDGLAAGNVNDQLSNLALGFDDLGDALSDAAFNDLANLGVSFLSTADEIEHLDEAMAGLAQTDPAQAARAFETIRAEAEAAGLTFEDLIALFPQYRNAVEQLGGIVPDGNPIMGFLGSIQDALLPGIRTARQELREAAGAAEAFSTQLARLNGFLDRRGAFRNYQAALDGLTDSIRTNGRSFDRTTEKGRTNEAALDEVARSAVQVAEHLNAVDRVKFMQRAEGDIRARAAQLGLPRDAVQRIIDKLHELDRTTADPRVTVNTAAALSGIAAVQAHLSSLRDRTVNVTVNRIGRGVPQDGGFASGGYITGPGTATSDSIPAWLSNGEYVVQAAAVERYGRAFFERVNAMAYAQGGYVSQPAAPVVNVSASTGSVVATISERDMDRLAERVGYRLERGVGRAMASRDQALLAGVRTGGR